MAGREARALSAPDFWRASRGFSLVWLVHLGRRHGLLAAFASGPLSVKAAALRARAAPAAARLWCEAAAALGLLEVTRGRYRLPQGLAPLLVDEDDPAYLGGHLDYLALRSLDFEAFDDFFRDGKPSARPQRHLVGAFEQATKWDHSAFLEALLPRVPALRAALRKGAEVLDVGSGAGAWDFRLARAFPRARVLGLEPDRTALRLARAGAARLGLDERVAFERGSAEGLRFDGRFDLVYLGEVLCSARETPAAIRKCRRALRRGGYLVVAEGLVDEAAPASDPNNALVLAMRLEFALQPAHLFTKVELARAFVRAGFPGPRFVGAGGGFYFAVARK